MKDLEEAESRMMVTKSWERGNGKILMGMKVSFWDD